jgi:sugar transferase (PEP-CTERM/EpsH1 system associated)
MPEPLRVTHVALSLDVGGLERNIVNQVRLGQGLGQQVSVICLERSGTLASQVEALGAPVICLHKRPGLRLELIGRMKQALRRLRPHIAHTHQIASLLYTGLAAKPAGVPVVVHTEHGKERYADRMRTRWLGRLAGRYTSRFFCLSKDMAAAVQSHGIVPPRKIKVILNGIDTICFQQRGQEKNLREALGIPLDAPVVGTVGRLTSVKQQHLLLRAFKQILDKVPRVHLLFVGDGPLLADLRRLARDLAVESVTHFAGYQSQPQRYLHVIDIFALTSASEGIPQALLEASAAGIPVVSSRVGGVPEVVDHGRTGLLFDNGDHQGLAHCLMALLNDDKLARRLAEAARLRVESTFHIGRMASEYHRQFLELLERKDSRVGELQHVLKE